MIDNMAKKIAVKMVRSKIVESEDEECYVYGLELLLSKIVVLSAIGIIAIIIKLIIPSIAFTFLYLLLRQYTGGFHCKTAERCISLSIAIYISFAIISKIGLKYLGLIMLVMSFISYIVLFAFSPLADANKEIDDYEKKKYRNISIIIGSLMLVLTVLLFVINYHSLFISVSFSLIADAILLIIAIMKERREKTCF